MASSISREEADRLARELTNVTGERSAQAVAEELLASGARFRAEAADDERTDDEILGYDEHGAPA